MNVSGYLTARLDEAPPEDTELAGHRLLDEIDLLTMAQIIDENQPVSAPRLEQYQPMPNFELGLGTPETVAAPAEKEGE